MSVRDARAHLADLITSAENGTPTVITRAGRPVAAVVPLEDFEALEDAVDRYFARQADDALAEEGGRTYSMSEVIADIFGENETGAA